eukprot:scaffold330268_cov73-Cyclotella_meneghiniana.AAC.1
MVRSGKTLAIISICTPILSSQTTHAFTPSPRHVSRIARPPSTSTLLSSSLQSQDTTFEQIAKKLTIEFNELAECSGILYSYVSKSDEDVTVEDVVRSCDMVDESAADDGETASTML